MKLLENDLVRQVVLSPIQPKMPLWTIERGPNSLQAAKNKWTKQPNKGRFGQRMNGIKV